MATSRTWDYDGPSTYVKPWVVPAGVTRVTAEVWGAAGMPGKRYSGAAHNGGHGGDGAKTMATFVVVPGQTLWLELGGMGYADSATSTTHGGVNYGSRTYQLYGGAGGGRSGIRFGSNLASNALVIAAGGGGGGGCPLGSTLIGGAGGDGGGPDGSDGASPGGSGGHGGKGAIISSPGIGGVDALGQSRGGFGSTGGQPADSGRRVNGGGGGGLLGGGSGGNGGASQSGGGGGGGRSYVNPIINGSAPTDITYESGPGTNNYHGKIILTWDTPPNVLPLQPVDGAIEDAASSLTFQWAFSDPDSTGAQTQAQVRWQATGSTTWTTRTISGDSDTYVAPIGSFAGNTGYVWQVRVADDEGVFSAWVYGGSFYMSGTSTPPLLTNPTAGETVEVDLPLTFTWQFRDPDSGDFQTRADIRWRVYDPTDTALWTETDGDLVTPGTNQFWTFPAGTFDAGFLYEWQARTYDNLSAPGTFSDWSTSQTFHSTLIGGSGGNPIPTVISVRGSLGCGKYRAMIFERGGQRQVGEITNIAQGKWTRVRDDISNCTLKTADYTEDCGDFYGSLRSMHHELVLYRDGSRIWEGPLTRLTYASDHLELEARDVMQYVYRRIMRQGYNDAYPNLQTVVYRASRIIGNALVIDDPNVLPYLTSLAYDDDTKESRIRQPYSSTAWEEVDDLAATAGLDYTVIGRRILLWDTHRPVGRLPMMTDKDFLDPPIVSEYGQNLATEFSVTNNAGVWGTFVNSEGDLYYGLVEMLASAYGESAAASTDVLTPAALLALRQTLADQAERNATGRYPAPLVVRVPDNSQLSPDVGVDINYLVPGVWIPLQATNTPRKVTQWQKLDSVSGTFDSSGEQIQVVMSPAPGAGADPDVAPETP